VEAGQPAQLTGTNRSIGFPRPRPAARTTRPEIAKQTRWPSESPGDSRGPQGGKPVPTEDTHNSLPADQTGRAGPRVKPGAALDQPLPGLASGIAGSRAALDGLVAIARGITPDPIPNSAVKTLCADGTAAQAAEE
jgi:hypothetical protein